MKKPMVIARPTQGWFIVAPKGWVDVFNGGLQKRLCIVEWLRGIPKYAELSAGELMDIWRKEYVREGYSCQKLICRDTAGEATLTSKQLGAHQ